MHLGTLNRLPANAYAGFASVVREVELDAKNQLQDGAALYQ